jgi:putative transcriptional regulator
LGRVSIIRIPGIQNGGSRNVNLEILKSNAKGNSYIASIGLEALASLRKAGIESQRFGSVSGSIEAAKSGLNSLVVCPENETADLIVSLEKEGIRYELIDAEIARS